MTLICCSSICSSCLLSTTAHCPHTRPTHVTQLTPNNQLHQQKWIKSDFSKTFVRLSKAHQTLRGDEVPEDQELATEVGYVALSSISCLAPSLTPPPHTHTHTYTHTHKYTRTHQFVRKTTKYWIRTSDISRLKHTVLQHLPVFQINLDALSGDSQLTNSVYLDNDRMELYHGRSVFCC